MRVHFRIKIRHALGTPLPCLGLRISESRLPHLSAFFREKCETPDSVREACQGLPWRSDGHFDSRC